MTNSSFISARGTPWDPRFEAEVQSKVTVAIYALTGEVITFIHATLHGHMRGHPETHDLRVDEGRTLLGL